MEPKRAANWRRERFRKYIAPLSPGEESQNSPQRSRDAEKIERTAPRFSTSLTPLDCEPAMNVQPHGFFSASPRLRGENSSFSSSDPPHSYQVAEDHGLDGLGGRDAGVTAAAALRHGLDGGGVFVERVGIADAGLVVEVEFEGRAGFGIAEFEFAGPGRSAIFVGPDLEEHELVAVVGQILEGAFAAGVVQEIGDHDDQAALGIG